MTLRFDPAAAAAYERLHRPGDARLIDALDVALDLLEADAGDKRCRIRSFGRRPLGNPGTRSGRRLADHLGSGR